MTHSRRRYRAHRGLGLAVVACLLALGLAVLVGPSPASAAPDLPALTGRVVDNANLLSASSASAIESKLKTLEDKSGVQLVVATVKSLGGSEIEPYANALFRAWKLGDQKKNNGVLLLVAPTERKARIEVGYGLEGTLTDAQSKLIIVNGMVPRFKTGDYQGGIETGVDDIIAVASTDQSAWSRRPDLQTEDEGTLSPFVIVIIVLGVIVVFIVLRRSGLRRGGGPGAGSTGGPIWSGSTSSSEPGARSGSSGPPDDNSISGGGGSSGGGGASDSW